MKSPSESFGNPEEIFLYGWVCLYYETYKNVNFVQEYGDGLKNYRLPE